MATSTTDTFEINGVIDTSQRVFDNIQRLCASSGAFFTYDASQGKYAVVINTTGTSVATFDDSNIIGGIQLSTLDVDEMYNAATVEFNHKDIKDGTDTINLLLDDEDQHTPNEIKNTLNMKFDLVNNPVQATYLAKLQIQQSRFDKIIQFRTDYSYQGLRAGDVIQVVNDWLGYPLTGNPTTLGYFRISSIKEIDDAENGFLLEITAFEYSDTVYTKNNLYRDPRDNKTGIKSRRENACLERKDDQKIGDDINKAFTPGTDVNDAIKSGAPNGVAASGFVPELAKRKFSITGPNVACEGETVTLNIEVPADCCTATPFTVPYTLSGTGITASDVSIPLTGNVTIGSGAGVLTFDIEPEAVTEGTETLLVQIGCNTHEITVHDQYLATPVYVLDADLTTVDECEVLTWTLSASNVNNGDAIPYVITGIDASDLVSGSLTGNFVADWCDQDGELEMSFTYNGQEGNETITMSVASGAATHSVTLGDGADYAVSFSPSQITEGGSTTATLTTQGIPDGTSVPYTITGSASGKVSSPALTGTVTVNSNTATLAISTNDDSTEDGVSTLLNVQFGPTTNFGSCTGVGQIEVLDNDGVSPEFTVCKYTRVPVVWCGSYNATTGYLEDMTVKKYANVPTFPRVGSAVTIPTAVSVTTGNPSTVAVTASVTAYTGTNIGGIPYEFITTFDSQNPLQPITGTTTTVRGFIDDN